MIPEVGAGAPTFSEKRQGGADGGKAREVQGGERGGDIGDSHDRYQMNMRPALYEELTSVSGLLVSEGCGYST